MSRKNSTYFQLFVFGGLEAALLWAHGRSIPTRDVIMSAFALLIVAVIRIIGPVGPPVTLVKSKLYKKLSPLLALAEFAIFLAVPWTLLLTSRGREAGEGKEDVLSYILASHLYIVQAQIVLEPLLIAVDRIGVLFWFIAATTAYAGLGSALASFVT